MWIGFCSNKIKHKVLKIHILLYVLIKYYVMWINGKKFDNVLGTFWFYLPHMTRLYFSYNECYYLYSKQHMKVVNNKILKNIVINNFTGY